MVRSFIQEVVSRRSRETSGIFREFTVLHRFVVGHTRKLPWNVSNIVLYIEQLVKRLVVDSCFMTAMKNAGCRYKAVSLIEQKYRPC